MLLRDNITLNLSILIHKKLNHNYKDTKKKEENK